MPPHKFTELCKQFQDAHGPLTLRLIIHEPDALSAQKHMMSELGFKTTKHLPTTLGIL